MKPCKQLFVEAEVAYSSASAFILDVSELDGPDLLAPYLSDQEGYAWVDLTSETMYVEITRGVDVSQSVASRTYAGTMEARILDAHLDTLDAHDVALNARVRVRVLSNPIFTGHITAFRTDYNAQEAPTVYLTAADGIAKLNATQIGERDAETYATRITQLCLEAGVSASPTGTGATLQAIPGAETALTALQTAQNSEGGLVFIDRWNTLHAWLRGEDFLTGTEDPDYVFANDHTIPGHVCISDFSLSLDTRRVINKVSFSNIENDGEGNFTNQTYIYSDPGSAAYYGVATQNLTTAVLPSELYEYQDWIFDNYATPTRSVRAVAFPTDTFTDTSIKQVAFIDIVDIARIYLVDPPYTQLDTLDALQRVAQISHRLTPQLWETQISFI